VSYAADEPPAAPGARTRAQQAARRVHGEPAPAPLGYQGLVTRAIAFTIDAAVINVVAVVAAAATALVVSALSLSDQLDPVLVALGGTLFLLWSAAYFVTFWSSTGQTPGNRVMEIRVVRARDGRALSVRRAVLRLVGLVLAALPLFAGFLPILIDDRRRGLHDMLAATVVVGVSATPGAASMHDHLEHDEEQPEGGSAKPGQD
jgi:uncharacterized RDD family membrane protein YckC